MLVRTFTIWKELVGLLESPQLALYNQNRKKSLKENRSTTRLQRFLPGKPQFSLMRSHRIKNLLEITPGFEQGRCMAFLHNGYLLERGGGLVFLHQLYEER